MEISDAWQNNIDQFIQKFVHPATAQGYLEPYWHTLSQFIGRDGAFGTGGNRMLPGNGGQIGLSGFERLGVLYASDSMFKNALTSLGFALRYRNRIRSSDGCCFF
jgi:hypothetical protein